MKEKERLGLVLEGGGMRGIYTAGVLDVFMEEGLTFDGVIGVSAGAIHGCSFVAGQKGRSIRYYKKYCKDKRFMSWWSLLFTGDIVGERFSYHDLPEKLDPYDYKAFQASKTEFYVTCSNLETGRAEYPRITDMRAQIDLLRASASLPYLTRIVEYRGRKLLDGGCTDSIPVEAFRNMGFGKNVVVLTRPQGYEKGPEHGDMARLFYRKYPRFIKALMERHLVYNRTLAYMEKLEKAGEIFVIRPREKLAVGRLEKDPEALQSVYDLGRRDAKACMAELRQWMNGIKRMEEAYENH